MCILQYPLLLLSVLPLDVDHVQALVAAFFVGKEVGRVCGVRGGRGGRWVGLPS